MPGSRSIIDEDLIARWIKKIGVFKIVPYWTCKDIAKFVKAKVYQRPHICNSFYFSKIQLLPLVCRKGDPSTAVYLIYEGKVKVVVDGVQCAEYLSG